MDYQENELRCRWCNPDFELSHYCSPDCQAKYIKVLRWNRKRFPMLKVLAQEHKTSWLYSNLTFSPGESLFIEPFRAVGELRRGGFSWQEITDTLNERYHKKWTIWTIIDWADMA